MAESSTITREGDGEVLRRLAALRCHQSCEAARDQDGGKTPCLDCPDPELRPYRDAARDLKAATPLSGDVAPDDRLTTGIKAGLEAAIRGIDATILNMGGECSRRGIQDPETGEVPCEGEDDRGCACSEALELGARLIANLRSADVARIAALATGGARDDVQCRCVSTFGPNPECGACGGSGCVSTGGARG